MKGAAWIQRARKEIPSTKLPRVTLHQEVDPPGALAGGRLEGAHPVGYGLDAGERGAAVGKRTQHNEQRSAHQHTAARVTEGVQAGAVDGKLVQVAQSGRTTPVTITLPMDRMKKYVGKAKKRPASRTPRRFP